MKNNFKLYETVLIYRKYLEDEFNVWNGVMDDFVGKKGEILYLTSNYALVNIENSNLKFYFPLESLRKLRKEKFKRILE